MENVLKILSGHFLIFNQKVIGHFTKMTGHDRWLRITSHMQRALDAENPSVTIFISFISAIQYIYSNLKSGKSFGNTRESGVVKVFV